VRCLRAGATVVFPDPSMPFELQVADPRVTHLSVVEVQLARLLASPGIPSHLRAVLAGGGPIGLSTIRRAIEAGLPLHTTYGMTETASQVATTGRLESAPRVVHAGRVLPGREVRIGAGGAIMVRGGVLAVSILEAGRWRCPADGYGWFDTGDVGFFDDGNLVVAGRKDRMIISGGENIHPEALEKILEEVAGVRRAVVVGVPDATWGARPVAFLAGTAAEAEVRRHLGGRVEDFAMPDRFLPWPDGVDPSAAKIDFRRFEKLARMG
jgi:o-succinylbenzoate---CoA ligase